MTNHLPGYGQPDPFTKPPTPAEAAAQAKREREEEQRRSEAAASLDNLFSGALAASVAKTDPLGEALVRGDGPASEPPPLSDLEASMFAAVNHRSDFAQALVDGLNTPTPEPPADDIALNDGEALTRRLLG